MHGATCMYLYRYMCLFIDVLCILSIHIYKLNKKVEVTPTTILAFITAMIFGLIGLLTLLLLMINWNKVIFKYPKYKD